MVVTTITVALLANARSAIWRFVAAARCTYERFLVTLSHKYLYSTPGSRNQIEGPQRILVG